MDLSLSCCFGDVVWTLVGIPLVTCVHIYLGADSAQRYLCPPVTVSVSFRFHSLCNAHSPLNCFGRNIKWSSCMATALHSAELVLSFKTNLSLSLSQIHDQVKKEYKQNWDVWRSSQTYTRKQQCLFPKDFSFKDVWGWAESATTEHVNISVISSWLLVGYYL